MFLVANSKVRSYFSNQIASLSASGDPDACSSRRRHSCFSDYLPCRIFVALQNPHVLQDDFNGFLWNVVMLAMGGLALGEAVSSSGLLLTVARGVSGAVGGLSVWVVLLLFCALVLVATTFISHTVGAMVILPIVQTVGDQLPVQLLPSCTNSAAWQQAAP